MARTFKVTAAHANHHGREAEGKVGELQHLLRHGANKYNSALRFGNQRKSAARDKVIERRGRRAAEKANLLDLAC
jgi:hypothetical protein